MKAVTWKIQLQKLKNSMWRWTVSPEKAPDAAEYLDIEYVNGDPVALNGEKMKPHDVLGASE